MQDAAAAEAPVILDGRPGLGAMRVRLTLKAKLTLGVLGILALNAGLGLHAYYRQCHLHELARDTYTRALIGVTHIDAARVALLHLMATRAETPDPPADTAPRADLAEMLDHLGIVIDRSATGESRTRAEDLRAAVAEPGRVPAMAADIETRLAALLRDNAAEAARGFEQVETLATQAEAFLLMSTATTACFVLLASVTLGRVLLQRQRSLARIAHISCHDSLTELPNRVAFLEALRYAALRAGHGEDFAVLCLDLDRFKQVNDTLGHPVGDQLLRAVAQRLLRLSRKVDTVARLGGDEFAVVQTAIENPDRAGLLAQRIVDDLREPYDVAGHRVVIGVSVGIAFGGAASRDPDTLMRNADLALYRAKQEGRGMVRFFEPDMDARAQARRKLELDLRLALERGEFELFYQPLVSVRDRTVASFEALIRWNHPLRGRVPPDDFIPLAEEIGLIVPIGAWVLNRACQEAALWPDSVSVAVNLSAVQFARSDIYQQVTAALRDSGLSPARLELEITETAMLNDIKGTLDVLHALRRLGIRISMDDFGTGYSSLSYLRSFPFDKLKIDRSFIRDLGETGESAAIVRAITAMGHSLGITTTAEGVETQNQMTQLVGAGCAELQGFLFSRPSPASEVPRLLADIAATNRSGSSSLQVGHPA